MDQVQGENVQPKKYSVFVLGLAEIFFTLLVLVFLFASLNFFNILKIGQVFPFLSFLPHLEQQTHGPSQPAATQQGPHIIPSQSPYSAVKAKASLKTFLESILLPANLPPGINTPKFNPTHGFNIYQVQWTLPNNTTAIASLFFRLNSNTLDRMHLAIALPADPNFVVNNTSAQEVIQSYFKEDASLTWHCTTTITQTYCEKFVGSPLGGQGYGIAKDTKNNLALFACLLSSEFSSNLKHTSCIK